MRSLRRLIVCILGLLFFGGFIFLTVPVTKEVTVVGWDFNTTRNASQYIYHKVLNTTLMPLHFCDEPSLLVIMVCSAPRNYEARNAIRETWGSKRNVLGFNVSLYFLLGDSFNSSVQDDVLLESDHYGDIIMEDFIDSYNNLTLKSIVMLKLLSKKCNDTAKYLFKVDDDMYVNIELLVEYVIERNASKDALFGSLICGARPIKNSNSKWYAPSYLYKDKVYPNYLSGTGYVMSVDVAGKLFEASLTTPIFHLEDVYLTGICAKKAGIKPHNNPKFTYRSMRHEYCVIKDLITVHHFTPNQLRLIYKALSHPHIHQKCEQKWIFWPFVLFKI